MRPIWVALVAVLLTTACGSDTEPVESLAPTPPTTAGDDLFLSFDGLDDRVLVPWDESFPTEVFTAAASIRLSDPPARRSAVIARVRTTTHTT